MSQNEYFTEFIKRSRERLSNGKAKYGDGIYNEHDLLNDIEEELLDLSNYAYLLYARIRFFEDKVHSDPVGFANSVLGQKNKG